MIDAELVGGVLDGARDPVLSARDLARLLVPPRIDRGDATRSGLHPDLVEVVKACLGDDRDRIEAACREGAAWVLGRRSVTVAEPWDLVASVPAGTALPRGLHRTTGETLFQLVVQATTNLRLVAPFMDRSGLSFLGDALAAATERGVALEVLLPTRSTHADEALEDLKTTIDCSGAPSNFAVSRLRFDAPWAHLKVLTCDSSSAYIGSANVTGAAIAGHNLELGVLVRGHMVAVVEQMIDLYRQR